MFNTPTDPSCSVVATRTAADAPDPMDFTDDALALRFVDLYADQLRFIANRSIWMAWSSEGRWEVQGQHYAVNLVRCFLRDEAPGCGDQRRKNRLRSEYTIGAVTRLTRSDPRISISNVGIAASRWAERLVADAKEMDRAELVRVWGERDAVLFRWALGRSAFPAELRVIAAMVAT